jgi:hypothetical protein
MATIEFTTEELNSEEWKLIPDFEMYEVSTLGRIRRAIACRASKKGRILKPGLSSSGYAQVSLVKVKAHTKSIHSIVAAVFIGPRPSPKHEVNHKNGNKHDPRLSNLEYLTKPENVQHSIVVLGHRVDGKHSPQARFTEDQILAIHDAMMNATPPVEIIERFSISETELYRIKNRKVWRELLRDLSTDYPKPIRRQPFYNLTLANVQEIKRRIANGETNQQIAKDYPIKSDSTIQFIRLGVSWKHVE